MEGTTKSNSEVAARHAQELSSQFSPGVVEVVGDDNTLAESGVHSSADELARTMRGLVQALVADADAIGSAAATFDEWDEGQTY